MQDINIWVYDIFFYINTIIKQQILYFNYYLIIMTTLILKSLTKTFIIINLFFIFIFYLSEIKLVWFISLLIISIRNNISKNNIKKINIYYFYTIILFLNIFFTTILLKKYSNNNNINTKYNKILIILKNLNFFIFNKILLIFINFILIDIFLFFNKSKDLDNLNIFFFNKVFIINIYYNKFIFFFFFEKKIKNFINFIKNLKNFNIIIKNYFILYKKKIHEFNYINYSILFYRKISTFFYFLIKKILVIFKWFILSFIISIIYFLFYYFYIQIEGFKQLIIWFFAIVFFYYIINIFNNIIIKLSIGKFITSIQRFWKRTAIIFWIIEIFLFLLFFYYFLNSSQEPIYFYDFNNLNQEILIQIEVGIYSNIILVFCIVLSMYLLFNINLLTHIKIYVILIILILSIFFMLCNESYQFFYIINNFNIKNLNLNENQLWEFTIEKTNFRVKQQYFIFCLLLKYWHFIFIFISWFFFFIKFIEFKKVNITLLSYNLQNLIILYILNLGCLIQWIKFLFKFKLEYNYNFFFFNYNNFYNILYEIYNIFFYIFN